MMVIINSSFVADRRRCCNYKSSTCKFRKAEKIEKDPGENGVYVEL